MTVQPLNRLQIAWRTAQDIQEGMLVKIGRASCRERV